MIRHFFCNADHLAWVFGRDMGYESDARLKLVNPFNNRLAAIAWTLLRHHSHQPLCESCSAFGTVEAVEVGACVAVATATCRTRVMYAGDRLSAFSRTRRFSVVLHSSLTSKSKTSILNPAHLTLARKKKKIAQGEQDGCIP